MSLRKIINSSTQQFEPVLVDKLVLDAVPTVNSFNSVTSDAVARAIAGASGEVPAVTESDNGKVLKAVYDEGGAAVEWGDDAVTVDQTYNALSENPQSGTAVAEAIAAIPVPSVDEVPDVTSSDDGKVLTASYSGGTGSYSWQTASSSGGGSSYTAGDGIDISNDEISVAYNSDTLDIAPAFVNLTPHESGSSSVYQDGTDLTNWVLNGVVGETLRVKIPSMAFLTGSMSSGDTIHIAISDHHGARFYSTALSMTYWGGGYMIDAQTVDVPLPVLSTTGWGGSMSEYPIDPESPYIRMTFARVNSGSVLNDYYASYFGGTQQSIQIANLSIGKLSVKNPLPVSTSSVANCVLKVDANGNPKWLRDEFTNTAGITDIQVVNSLPAYPGSTVLYLIPET